MAIPHLEEGSNGEHSKDRGRKKTTVCLLGNFKTDRADDDGARRDGWKD